MRNYWEESWERKERKKLERQVMLIRLALVLVIIAIGIVTLIRLDTVLMQQTETLNQLMELRQEVDAVEVVEEAVSLYPLTETERDIVERVVAAESRGESIEGMRAVAQVIRDRSLLWEQTVIEVVLSPKQFAEPYQGEVTTEVKVAVADVFDIGTNVFEEPTTFFHADYISDPYWTIDKVNRGSIGGHKFYY